MNDPIDRGRRLEHQQRAYELQLIGGLQGMARWTVYGLVGIGAMHQFWPLFRKQTWALKAFLLSSTSIFGLVIGADDYLLKYESAQRDAENAIRREARNALARRGIIATEGEIRRWKAERAAEVKAQEAQLADIRAAEVKVDELRAEVAAEGVAAVAAEGKGAVLAALKESRDGKE